MVNKTEVYNLVKIKAGLGSAVDPDRDPIVECAVDEAEELILNYIHRNEMPSAAKMVFVAVATDIYKYNVLDFDLDKKFESEPDPSSSDGDYLQNASEIRVDDIIVRDEITAAEKQANANVKTEQAKAELDFLKNYKERLQRFRMVQWRKWEEGM